MIIDTQCLENASISNWSNVLFIISYVVTLIVLVRRFIKEKKYPICYRILDYLGHFLFFISPFLILVIASMVVVNEKILAGTILMFLGIGGICIGVSLKLLPINHDIKSSRKKYWKICIGIGIYIVLYSLLFMIYV